MSDRFTSSVQFACETAPGVCGRLVIGRPRLGISPRRACDMDAMAAEINGAVLEFSSPQMRCTLVLGPNELAAIGEWIEGQYQPRSNP